MRRGQRYIEQAFNAVEQEALHRVHETMDALEHDERLIAQAAAIEERRERLAAEYFKTPRGRRERAQVNEMRAIVDGLKRAKERKAKREKQSTEGLDEEEQE